MENSKTGIQNRRIVHSVRLGDGSSRRRRYLFGRWKERARRAWRSLARLRALSFRLSLSRLCHLPLRLRRRRSCLLLYSSKTSELAPRANLSVSHPTRSSSRRFRLFSRLGSGLPLLPSFLEHSLPLSLSRPHHDGARSKHVPRRRPRWPRGSVAVAEATKDGRHRRRHSAGQC